MKLHLLACTVLPALAIATATPAQAQSQFQSSADQAPAQVQLQQRALAATCAACHGTEGRAPAGSALSTLAGRTAPWLVEQLQAFKTGQREATVMHQIARGYSDAQIQQLAAFFAAQKP
jgi:cytochrome c553